MGPAGTELHKMPCRAHTGDLWPQARVQVMRPSAVGAAWQILQGMCALSANTLGCSLANRLQEGTTCAAASRTESCDLGRGLCASCHTDLRNVYLWEFDISRSGACGAVHEAGQDLLCAYMDDAVMTSTIAVAASTGTQLPLMSHLRGRLYSLCSMAWLLLLLLLLLFATAGARCARSASL